MTLRIAIFCLVPMAFAATPIEITVSNQKNSSVGLDGRVNLFLSDAFQPAEWQNNFFADLPGQTKVLGALNPKHINIQAQSEGLAQTGPDTWDFTINNSMVPGIQSVGDHDPLYQIASAPAFMQTNGSLAPANFPQFAGYAANLVRYFNKGGFDAGGTHYQSQSPYPFTYWGIFNEPDVNNVSATDYPSLYNQVVPAMKAVDPNIKFVALELAYLYDYLPQFLQKVKAPVDVIAMHFYGACGGQASTDAQVFGSLDYYATGMASGSGSSMTLPSARAELAKYPALAKTPIWMTENNVDADYSNNGESACLSDQPYQADMRESSPFYAAFYPLLFQRWAENGVQGINHWVYAADGTFGEVDQSSGKKYLTYWVDYWLAHLFPAPPGADILKLTTNDTSGHTDAFAVRNDDGSVVVMLINHQIASPSDNNGRGVANTFSLDTSALGSFSSVTQVQIDENTDPSAGPKMETSPYMPNLQASLPGYGVVFFKLNQTLPKIGAVVNGASYKNGPVAPGELITIFGEGMGPPQAYGAQVNVPGFLSNSLAGARVLFDGVPAALIYESALQISALVPYEVAGQTSTSVQLEYLGSTSAAVSLPVVATSPALFTEPPTGTGLGAILDQNYQLISSTNPAKPGDNVILYLTGEGNVDPDAMDGRIASGAAPKNTPVTVTIGGVKANTTYAGRAPGQVFGIMQINAVIPNGMASGNAPVQVTIGKANSPAGVTIAIQ
ncbi:MAG TPA: hypothetical protein VKT81_17555 [Bryobacteraceae bacterium]|nr:hypothetical protein [Bryobacteraceae bacterium]